MFVVKVTDASYINETGKFAYVGDYRFSIGDGNRLSSVATRYFNTGMMIVSAFRQENSLEENLKKHEQLCQEIRDNDLGFVSSLGGFKEKGQEYGAEELSIIVPYRKDTMSEEDFANLAVELCKEYNQDSVLLCLPSLYDGRPFYITKNADVDMMFEKQFSLTNKEDEYYTRIKGQKAPNSFTLRSEDGKFTTKDEVEQRYIGWRVPKSFQQAVKLSKYKGNY